MGADPLEALRRKFPNKPRSWLKRALARVGDVSEGPGYYVVRGRSDLGDKYPQYHVWWSEAERRWVCTCYLTEWGSKRARDICTHVAAVLFYREYGAAGAGKRYVATMVVECPQRPSANGEVFAKLVAGGKITDYQKPKWRVAVVSSNRLEVEANEAYIIAKEFVSAQAI
ncbi:MAG: hypothetical protein QXP98_03455 [Thermoproteus sp.]